ncbi:ABC transporter permease [Cryobacterium sp. BB307]|uniref:ABC transporter permease n=1 Tax=Cryobacterium sp. BB307 TaxID=2716317 RepID=UPI001444CB06|nr:ABC transporter permease [Cryobacterium sp. BB307]
MRIGRWVLTRALGGIFVLWAVATLIFFAMRAIPGDPAEAILGGPGSQASDEAITQVRSEYGLDRPLYEQYLLSLGRLATGDLGTSYALKADVAGLVGELFLSTLILTVLSLLVAWAFALALALWATRGGRIGRMIGSGMEIIAAAVPHFWLASIFIVIFSTALGWLPPISTPGPLGLVLPVLTLAIPLAGFLGQVMRESLTDALESPFVLSARARGESETGVRWRHAIRHAALPAISLSGWAFGSLISGAVVVETVFARPGLGRSLLNAVLIRDVPMVTGVALISALAFVLVTIATDAIDRVADPRLRSA